MRTPDGGTFARAQVWRSMAAARALCLRCEVFFFFVRAVATPGQRRRDVFPLLFSLSSSSFKFRAPNSIENENAVDRGPARRAPGWAEEAFEASSESVPGHGPWHVSESYTLYVFLFFCFNRPGCTGPEERLGSMDHGTPAPALALAAPSAPWGIQTHQHPCLCASSATPRLRAASSGGCTSKPHLDPAFPPLPACLSLHKSQAAVRSPSHPMIAAES
jgi:hypothetical protein